MIEDGYLDGTCAHIDIWFDRSLCGWCGVMHYYCEDCGLRIGECFAPQYPFTDRPSTD